LKWHTENPASNDPAKEMRGQAAGAYLGRDRQDRFGAGQADEWRILNIEFRMMKIRKNIE